MTPRTSSVECIHADGALALAQAAAATLDGVEVLAATPNGVRLRVASLQTLTRYWRTYAAQGASGRGVLHHAADTLVEPLQ